MLLPYYCLCFVLMLFETQRAAADDGTVCNQTINVAADQKIGGLYTTGQDCYMKLSIDPQQFLLVTFTTSIMGSGAVTLENSNADYAQLSTGSQQIAFPPPMAYFHVQAINGQINFNADVKVMKFSAFNNVTKYMTSSGGQAVLVEPIMFNRYTFDSSGHVALNVLPSSGSADNSLLNCFVYDGSTVPGQLLGTLRTIQNDMTFTSVSKTLTVFAAGSVSANTLAIANDNANVAGMNTRYVSTFLLNPENIVINATTGPATLTLLYPSTNPTNYAYTLNNVEFSDPSSSLLLYSGTQQRNVPQDYILASYSSGDVNLQTPQQLNQPALTFRLNSGTAKLSLTYGGDPSPVAKERQTFVATAGYPFSRPNQFVQYMFYSQNNLTQYNFTIHNAPATTTLQMTIRAINSDSDSTDLLGLTKANINAHISVIAQNITVTLYASDGTPDIGAYLTMLAVPCDNCTAATTAPPRSSSNQPPSVTSTTPTTHVTKTTSLNSAVILSTVVVLLQQFC